MKHSIGKHKGSKLLIFVLVAFVVLALLSAVAVRITGQTKRVEMWQMASKKQMLTELTRSAIITIAEAISADKEGTIVSKITPVAISANELNIKDGSTVIAKLRPELQSSISGNIVNITITAADADDRQKVKITGSYNKATHKIVRWVRYDD